MEESIQQRKRIARSLLSAGLEPEDFLPVTGPEVEVGPGLLVAPTLIPRPPRVLEVDFPSGLRPRPVPRGNGADPAAPLPRADVVVITWTAAEADALASVFTPGFGRNAWHRYSRFFADRYRRQIRDGAPAAKVNRLGSYFPTRIGSTSVLCFKSELHLNQDSIRTGEGTATLPVKDLFLQLIDEVKPRLVLTIGTSGAVFPDHTLGDVVVTRAAKFRLADEFRREAFNGRTYRSEGWRIPTRHLPEALRLMRGFAPNVREPAFAPPTRRFGFQGPPLEPAENEPDIKLEGTGGMPEFHPILTTDFFEYGTSANRLDREGCAVEMGDAVLGLVSEELGGRAPDWGVVRNISDPEINAELPLDPVNMQTHWAVWYYETYGYWTSVMGALTTWGLIAGYEP